MDPLRIHEGVGQFKPADIGDTVFGPFPDIDGGLCEATNLKALVLDIHDNGHL